jgi:hypothetical protein
MLNFAHENREVALFHRTAKSGNPQVSLPPLKEDEVLVETICSAISAGTEMLVYRGQFPQLTDAHDASAVS